MDTVYVDGTKTGGANNGSSSDPYEGAVGLQTALDAVNNGNETNMYVRNTFSLGATIDVDAAGGDKQFNRWLTIIGCEDSEDSWIELADGSYNIWDGQGGVFDNCKVKDVDNIWFKHIHFYNAAAGRTIFDIGHTGTHYNIALDHCKGSECARAVEGGGGLMHNLTIIGGEYSAGRPVVYCVVIDVQNVTGVTMLGVKVGPGEGRESIIINNGTIAGCVIESDTARYAILHEYNGHLEVYNNVFYKVGGGIELDSLGASLVEYNNIYDLYDAAANVAVFVGSYGTAHYSDYSACNRASGAFVGAAKGANVVDIADDDLVTECIDPANDDFRLKPTSLCLNTGRPTYGDGVNTGYTDIGAWQRISRIRR